MWGAWTVCCGTRKRSCRACCDKVAGVSFIYSPACWPVSRLCNAASSLHWRTSTFMGTHSPIIMREPTLPIAAHPSKQRVSPAIAPPAAMVYRALPSPTVHIPRARASSLRICAQQQAEAKQRKVAIFVEPSPFSHVSGMKNRFECLIKGLRDAGDDVVVFTPDRAPPKEFHGARVCCTQPTCITTTTTLQMPGGRRARFPAPLL